MSDFAYPLHEECGVFGIYDRAGSEDVAAAAYSALYALQHRGQESCGIAVNDDGVIVGHRDLGLVNEVFTPAVLAGLANPSAHMATGHVRYATAGSRVRANAQPMIVRHGRGTMALCHNGNLTNAIELRRQLENEGAIFHGSSDTEVICYLVTRNRLRMGSIETAISKTMDVLEGAYSLVIMSATKLIAVRDPRGYRPLCIGTLPGGGYVFASESCALDAAGATPVSYTHLARLCWTAASGSGCGWSTGSRRGWWTRSLLMHTTAPPARPGCGRPTRSCAVMWEKPRHKN